MDVSRSRIVEIIQEWNATRLEMFELSLPDENLEFYGVMRFYYYENDGNIATKCLRVYSTATVSDVVFALLDKLSSIKLISTNISYGMCEVHPDQATRVLDMDELPLLLQLTWMKDCIEGRFLLRQSDNFNPNSKSGKSTPTDDIFLAKDLYEKIPENSFTQSIANLEVVMRRKRHQKLDRKLVEISGVDGSPDKGAPLRIYGTLLNPNIPYKTLLLSYKDTAHFVVKEMLSKYMMSDQDPEDYALVKLTLPAGVTEYSYDDIMEGTPLLGDDIPFIIRSKHNPTTGLILFHIIRRTLHTEAVERSHLEATNLPYIKQAVGPAIVIHTGITIFGHSQPTGPKTGRFVEISGDDILWQHAEVNNDGKLVMVAPFEKAKLYVNHVPVYDNFVLLNGDTIQFGACHPYRLYMPGFTEYSTEFVDKCAPSLETKSPGNLPPLLPAEVTFKEEDALVLLRHALSVSPSNTSFKLGPAFFVYLLSRQYSVDNSLESSNSFLLNAAASFSGVVKKSLSTPTVIAFWISNCVELLQLLIQDHFLTISSSNILTIFLEACTLGYDELLEIISRDLDQAASCFFADVDDGGQFRGTKHILERVFDVVGSTIFMFQTNRMHPSITLLFFGELFSLLNHKLFKMVISSPKLCCFRWGVRLANRLEAFKSFIVVQGLEQSVIINLQMISELADLLCIIEEDISSIGQLQCLNSLQVEFILDNYSFAHPNKSLSPQDRQQILHRFMRDVDSLMIRSNKSIVMLEDVGKQPFSLPKGDYQYECMASIPPDFIEYVATILDNNDLCQLTVNGKQVTVVSVDDSVDVTDSRDYDQYGAEISRQLLSMNLPLEPDVISFRISKINGSLGISLASALSQSDGSSIIIVDSIVKNGAAFMNGRIQPFDQLLSVDSYNLINVSLSRVTQIMINSSDFVQLKIIRGGALYHLPFRLLKNVSPKFNSLLDGKYSSMDPPHRELDPVILSPIKLDSSMRQNSRVHSTQDQPQQSKPSMDRLSRSGKGSNNFLLKLNSIPTRSDSKPQRTGDKSDRSDVLKHFSFNAPSTTYSSHMSSVFGRATHADKTSSPHVARVVHTTPPEPHYSHPFKNVDRYQQVLPSSVPQKWNMQPEYTNVGESALFEEEDIKWHTSPKQVAPERISSLNHASRLDRDYMERETRPNLRMYDDCDYVRKAKSVTFTNEQERVFTIRGPPFTEDDYRHVYKSALKDVHEPTQSAQLYNID